MKKSRSFRFSAVCLVAAVIISFCSCGRSQESSLSSSSSDPISEYSQNSEFPSQESETSSPESSSDLEKDPIILPDFKEEITQQYKSNSHTVGWVSVPGTDIYDAVVQYTDNDYYLRKNKNRKYAYSGCYFADYESKMGDRDSISKNTIIYGHNLGCLGKLVDDARSEKFGPLFNFLDKDFAEANPYIYFSTAEENMVWEVFAVYYTEASFGTYNPKFKFNLVNVSNSYFEYMIDEALQRSVWDYGIRPTANDKILTLATCSYKYGTVKVNGILEMKTRFIVMARLVEKDARLHSSVQVEPNSNIKEPILADKYS